MAALSILSPSEAGTERYCPTLTGRWSGDGGSECWGGVPAGDGDVDGDTDEEEGKEEEEAEGL